MLTDRVPKIFSGIIQPQYASVILLFVTDQWTTPYGDVPPTQNQPWQWPSYPPPPPTWDKSQNRSWNGLAIASFVLGICRAA